MKPSPTPKDDTYVRRDQLSAPRPAGWFQDMAVRVLAGVGGLALLSGLAYGILQLIH